MKALKWLTIASIIFIFLCPIFFPKTVEEERTPTVQTEKVAYDFANCPIKVTGRIIEDGENYILDLTFDNLGEHTISAIKCIFVCYNVYGEQNGRPRSFTYQRYCIDAYGSRNAKYLISRYNKSVKLYAYSVYYKNNYKEEWGYRNISCNNVIDNAPVTYIEYLR